MNEEFELRDKRRNGFFIIDNHVLDSCAKPAGPFAWTVYCCLCRLAINTRKIRVSVREISSRLGLGVRTVVRARKKLEELYMIRRKKTLGISIVEILDVAQLDFTEKLISSQRPVEASVDRPPEALGKGLQRPLRKAPRGRTSLKTFSKTTPYRSSRGIEQRREDSKKVSESDPWKPILGELRKHVSPHSFDTWLKPTRFSYSKAGTIYVRIPTQEFQHIEAKFGDLILDAMERHVPNFEAVKFVVSQ